MGIKVLHKREFKLLKPLLKMSLLAPLLLFLWTLHGTFSFLPLPASPGSGPPSSEVFIISLPAASAAVPEQPAPSLSFPPPSHQIFLLPLPHCTLYPDSSCSLGQAPAPHELRAGTPEIRECFWSRGKNRCGFFPAPLRLFQDRFFSQMWVLRRFGGAGAAGGLGSSRTQILPIPLLLERSTALADKPWLPLAVLHHFNLDFDTVSLSPVLTEWGRKLCVFEQIAAL